MSEEDNRGFDNLIPLCERHAYEIDATPQHYPADLLRSWKRMQIEAHARAVGLALNDAEVAELSEASFNTDDLIERLTAVMPFSARSRSRAEALALAARSSRARSVVRLRSTPADRVEAALAWNTQQADPVVEVPTGALRVLVAPMGAGKSEEAERWWNEGLTQAWTDPQVAIPVWLEARDVVTTLAGAVQDALGGDPEKACRIVVDNLDGVSPREADRLLDDARRLVATWPLASILATTRPGAGRVDTKERLDVAVWPAQRGMALLETVLGDDHIPRLDSHETRQLLTTPLQVHALASHLRAGGHARVSTRELLSGLARDILELERPDASREVWASLPRLATRVLSQQGPVRATDFARTHVIWELEETGLVVHDDGQLRFALPLFEQHFAAQALQDEEALIETAAGSELFPRWRYAIAFAVASVAQEQAEGFLLRLARTNPAAASWVLEETARRDGDSGAAQRPLSDEPATRAAERPESAPEHALAVGGRLREATRCWLEGVGELGALLAPHHDGALAPWAVLVGKDDEWMILAEARERVLDAELVVRPDLIPWGSVPRGDFHSIHGFPVPRGDLARWVWARNRLREQLIAPMHNRTLPVDPASPLAAERVWFLARHIMGNGQNSRNPRQIALADLRSEVNERMAHIATTRRSQWTRGRHTIESSDIRWLHDQLQHVPGGLLTDPRPPADIAPGGARYTWQMYSPELTLSIAQDVLRDALIGYRDLVQRNFPRFGAALGLYSTFPLRAEGFVIMPDPDDTAADCATIAYALLPDAHSRTQDEPVVDLRLARSPDDLSTLWDRREGDNTPAFQRQVGHYGRLPTGRDRRATNLAYRWLAEDLKAVGWLEHAPVYTD
ncbi:hypothetical protein [Streptomyces sp. CC77]|uniref:hypothetical protein n=2 Tax=unclassified Streptomyces TaxID=2593676 RepID=UPI0008DCD250|nr:hypothetical protein [Streptomyces sp. CC77]OII69870.1 hypothetical protein BJP39_03405 [Streptomyces sp. CC77]